MFAEVIDRLLDINKQFYQNFALPFSQTRQTLQPGVRRILPRLLAWPDLLELGCGNGELARQLAQHGFRGAYYGVDFSAGLLKESQAGLPEGFHANWIDANLAQAGWEKNLPDHKFSGIVAFAVLHHLPGGALRRGVLETIRGLLKPGGVFIHSNWQFLNSEKLRRRVQSWERVGLSPGDVEPGDYLLDWRQGGEGLRYVHHFTPFELEEAAAQAGFTVLESFTSDGKTGNLGLYQVWSAL